MREPLPPPEEWKPPFVSGPLAGVEQVDILKQLTASKSIEQQTLETLQRIEKRLGELGTAFVRYYQEGDEVRATAEDYDKMMKAVISSTPPTETPFMAQARKKPKR